jgi:protein gp37
MGEETGISWTNATWNPWHGCAKVSAGCKNCYMFREKKQYGQDPTLVVRSKTKFDDPLKWVSRGKAPKYCFTCSWSDFFVAQADPWRSEAWDIIKATPEITYQILTKRPERIAMALPDDWGTGYANVWLGVSCENQATANERIPLLIDTRAAVRFISAEPLLGPLDLLTVPLYGETFDVLRAIRTSRPTWPTSFCSRIGWVIVGGESGPGARPMHPDWARSLRDHCQAAGVPFFFKQWGEYAPTEIARAKFTAHIPAHIEFADGTKVMKFGTKNSGAVLDGREWHEFPEAR